MGKRILLISPEAWGKNFVSKHHYANYLSKEHEVFFLNPPSGYAKFGNMKVKTTKIHDRLTVIDYLNRLPKLDKFSLSKQIRVYKKQAKIILESIGITDLDIVWSFDPNRFFNQAVWGAENSIYHTVDFHPNSKYESEIVLSSDLFLGVADKVLEDTAKIRKGKLISHGADIDGFQKDFEAHIPGTNNIKAIYTGNFHKHIDYELLEDLVDENEHVDFIMIGPTKKSNISSSNSIDTEIYERLQAKENICFLGSVPSEHLMSYLKKCDINLVMFRKEFEKIHCSPHKLMAYFYSGNITLSNYIDAHKNTPKNIILMEPERDVFKVVFKDIVANLTEYNSAVLREKRKSFAIENSYQIKINEILKQINKCDSPS